MNGVVVFRNCVLLLTLACAVTAHARLFHVNKGAVVVDHSPLVSGEVAEEMLGLVPDTGPEQGTLIFADDFPVDTVHFVEWTMPEPILVRRIQLRAIADSCTTDRRTFKHFRLVALHDGLPEEVLVDEDVPVPYQYEFSCRVLLVRDFPDTMADRFRAEYTQHRMSGFEGPRVIELEGYEYSVCGDTDKDDGAVNATDALRILTQAVANRFCAKCVCDVTNDDTVSATDALAVLQAAVGQPVALDCRACNPPAEP